MEDKDKVNLEVRFHQVSQAIERVVWDRQLDSYQNLQQLRQQLIEMFGTPHAVLFEEARYYLGKLRIDDKRQAGAICALGEVVYFAGVMATAFNPSGSDGTGNEGTDDGRPKEEDGDQKIH